MKEITSAHAPTLPCVYVLFCCVLHCIIHPVCVLINSLFAPSLSLSLSLSW